MVRKYYSINSSYVCLVLYGRGTKTNRRILQTTCPVTSNAKDGVLLTLPPPNTLLPRYKPLCVSPLIHFASPLANHLRNIDPNPKNPQNGSSLPARKESVNTAANREPPSPKRNDARNSSMTKRAVNGFLDGAIKAQTSLVKKIGLLRCQIRIGRMRLRGR